jgi:type IV pilus assembly protein PilY1
MDASGGTPLKAALSTAGRNFAGKLGPDPVQYSCQQNFLILTTDGYWNAGSENAKKVTGSGSVGNQDNSLSSTPRPMYDGGQSGASDTLADAAAYYYNTDLRSTSFGNCTGALGSGIDVCEDNVFATAQDPKTTQHMTTFTLGLGTNGKLSYASDYLTGGSADYNAIITGAKNWPVPQGDTLTTIDDLWHAAVNGRGQYFAAKNPDLLVGGLHTALAAAKTREAAGSAAATSNLQPVPGDNSAYIASYRTMKWDGDVEARLIDLQTAALSATPVWTAQPQLDARVSDLTDTRDIFTYVNGSQVLFKPSSFTAAQKNAWFNPSASPALSQTGGWSATQTTAATPDTLINYLRGQTGFEERSTNVVQLYRNREHVLGDIVDARPVYVKRSHLLYNDAGYAAFNASQIGRQGAVYVAANDGMLHAFNSDTGAEMWAYVPSFVLPNLKALADDNYATQHQYFVDGSPNAGDIYTGSAWKTIIVGGLGAGGKGYYALDITNPASPSVLWEFTDANMGFSYATPIIGKLADGTWVVVVSSGYNNADGVGRLYVLNAATGALRFTISTGVGTAANPSGLGKIVGFSIDGLHNNTIERVYGGDMLGNVWRFDLNDTIPPAGRDAFLLASLKVGTTPQPITTTPEVGTYIKNGITYNYVYVGTGRYLGTTDLTDTSQQSLYGLVDKFTATGIGDVRNSPNCPIVAQTLSNLSSTSRTTSHNAFDPASACGWYVDFNPGNSTPGERVNVDMSLQLGVLAVGTNVPMNSVCTVGGTSWLYFFNYLDGTVLPGANNVAGQQFDNSILVGLTVIQIGTGGGDYLPDPNCTSNCTPPAGGGGGRTVTLGVGSDKDVKPTPNPPSPSSGAGGKRVMWRELLK